MISTCKEWLKRYLQLGIVESKDHTINQQIFVSNLFSLIGYTITFVMAVSATVRENYILALCLYTASILFFAAHQIHRFGNLHNSHKISSKIVLISLLILMVYLIYTGGHNNTGPLWIYIVPPVAFFFGGMRKGLANIGLFVIITAIMLFYPGEILLGTSYEFSFKSRLLYSFSTVTLLFGFYEYSRQKSIQNIQNLSDKFEQQAMYDMMTGLPNRRAMREYLQYEYDRSQRSEKNMSVLLCDIDHFKKVNDQHGHDGGDVVLQELAILFTNSLRKQDKTARWGGEEFLFLLPETNAFEAHVLAEKIRKKVASTEFHYNKHLVNITVSIGIKEVDKNISVDKAITLADEFLYQAKESGRNTSMPKFDASGDE